MTQDPIRPAEPTAPPRVAAIILAAGLSSRSAATHKLLSRDASGRAMISHVVQSALQSRASEIIIVTGHCAEKISDAALEDTRAPRNLRFVHCARFADGMSASIASGIAAISADAALICLADMPLVTASILNRLIDAFAVITKPVILVPTCAGRPGNPVLWSQDFFAGLCLLCGDRGGREFSGHHAGARQFVETGDPGVLTDFDAGFP